MSDKRVLTFLSLCFFKAHQLTKDESIFCDFIYLKQNKHFLSKYIFEYIVFLGGWISRILVITRCSAFAQSVKYWNFKAKSNSFWLTRLSHKQTEKELGIFALAKGRQFKTEQMNIAEENRTVAFTQRKHCFLLTI